jgi:hypothetical protein
MNNLSSDALLGGLFLGKVLTKHQHVQKIVLEIDRLVLSQDGFGFVGKYAYQVQWLADQTHGNVSIFRQIFGNRSELLELVNRENSDWEAYICNAFSDRKGNISKMNWDWGGNLPCNWHKMAMLQFTKL